MPSKSQPQEIVFTNAEPITFADYVDGVRVAAPYMKSMAMTLVNAKPSDLSAEEKRQLDVIVEVAKHGDDVIDERQSVVGVRPWFIDFGNAWGGFNDALLAKSRLPASMSDKGERAAKLNMRLFPDGVMFVRRDSHAAWSDGDRRLALIAELGLEREIAAVIGDDHLDAARKATAALGEALGVGKTAREAPKGSDLQETIGRFSREVARYARMIAASVDLDDPASVERFRNAVAKPIDTLRSRRGAADDEDTSLDAPVVDGGPSPVTPSPVVAPVA
jgi:hypothetical protein